MTQSVSQNRITRSPNQPFEQEDVQEKSISKHPVIGKDRILAHRYAMIKEDAITHWASARSDQEWNQQGILKQIIIHLDVNEIGKDKELDKEQKMIDSAIDAQKCFVWSVSAFILGSCLAIPVFGWFAPCIVGLPLGALFFTSKLAYEEYTKRDPKIKEVDDLRLARLRIKIQYIQNALQSFSNFLTQTEKKALEKIQDVFQGAVRAHEKHYSENT